MNAPITVQLATIPRIYETQTICYEETINVPITFDVHNYYSDAYITFEAEIIRILAKCMLQSKDIDDFQIILSINNETINHVKRVFNRRCTIHTKNTRSLKKDIQQLKYRCFDMYVYINTTVNCPLAELQNDLIEAIEKGLNIRYITSHARRNIDQIR